MPGKKENSAELIGLLRRMWLIRAFEEKVSSLYAERQIVGLLHLGIGQEAVAVGALSLLRADDYVYGGHRSHGHAVAKGDRKSTRLNSSHQLISYAVFCLKKK